jgi:hypothetical protein
MTQNACITKIKKRIDSMIVLYYIKKEGGRPMERTVKTIRFPVDILQEIRPVLDETKMNFTTFLIEAAKNYLRVLQYEKGVNASFGAWKDENHPEFEAGVDGYIREVRKGRTY